ncbi:MAG: DUF493 domain-containing protein [Pseudomonadota bacterium]
MEPERISFPAEYPIKVVARAEPDLRTQVDATFLRHFGALAAENVTERPSTNGNFVAWTYVPVVRSADQLRALHADLTLLDGVVMVL